MPQVPLHPSPPPRSAPGRVGRLRQRVERFLSRDVWTPDIRQLPWTRRCLYKLARVAYLTGRGTIEDRCTSRAAALTYVTVLSIVPLLAFAFSVAKGMNAYSSLREDVVEPFLEELDPTLEPDADLASPAAGGSGAGDAAIDGAGAAADAPSGSAPGQLREAADRILDLVENTDFGSLGAIGLLLLIYTVLKLLSSIEGTMNDIWGVRRARSWTRKVADYISMLVVVPLLLMASTALTATLRGEWLPASVQASAFYGEWVQPLGRVLALLGPVVGFTFIYLFIPNTRVRVRSALWGGLLGGVLWQALMLAHVQFQVGVARTNAIYSTFAALPVFLVWLFGAWNIVLLGAELACAHQNEPHYGQVARARNFDPRLLEAVAVRAMVRIASRFRAGEPPLNSADLADQLGVPVRTLNDVLGHLTENRLLIQSEGEGLQDGQLVPARTLESIRIQQILDALKGPSSESRLDPHGDLDNHADAALDRFRAHRDGDPANQRLSDLLDPVS